MSREKKIRLFDISRHAVCVYRRLSHKTNHTIAVACDGAYIVDDGLKPDDCLPNNTTGAAVQWTGNYQSGSAAASGAWHTDAIRDAHVDTAQWLCVEK